jgi:hypothetical protein
VRLLCCKLWEAGQRRHAGNPGRVAASAGRRSCIWQPAELHTAAGSAARYGRRSCIWQPVVLRALGDKALGGCATKEGQGCYQGRAAMLLRKGRGALEEGAVELQAVIGGAAEGG